MLLQRFHTGKHISHMINQISHISITSLSTLQLTTTNLPTNLHLHINLPPTRRKSPIQHQYKPLKRKRNMHQQKPMKRKRHHIQHQQKPMKRKRNHIQHQHKPMKRRKNHMKKRKNPMKKKKKNHINHKEEQEEVIIGKNIIPQVGNTNTRISRNF